MDGKDGTEGFLILSALRLPNHQKPFRGSFSVLSFTLLQTNERL